MATELDEAVRVVEALSLGAPAIGVVLGSGLGAFAAALDGRVAVPYRDIPGFPPPSVSGHGGELVFGRVRGVLVACLSGRVHLYEGHAPNKVVFGVRLLAALGCGIVLVTNAAGGIREGLTPGGLLLLRDHVNLTGTNALVGPNEPPFPRFPDMSAAYDIRCRDIAREVARDEALELDEGVYAGVLGPSYETPAEIRMLRTLGADAVGMSTVLEVIALRHRGVRVGAVSVITNMAAGLSNAPLDHAEVQATGAAARDRLERLLSGWIERLAPEVALG
ncbi:MAG TPA: purine-nucleoside phosphorylase [Polyangiaceae bacterium]|nr:purine-nucleoside phosphorylase [Polyangiaceae bacterium]